MIFSGERKQVTVAAFMKYHNSEELAENCFEKGQSS